MSYDLTIRLKRPVRFCDVQAALAPLGLSLEDDIKTSEANIASWSGGVLPLLAGGMAGPSVEFYVRDERTASLSGADDDVALWALALALATAGDGAIDDPQRAPVTLGRLRSKVEGMCAAEALERDPPRDDGRWSAHWARYVAMAGPIHAERDRDLVYTSWRRERKDGALRRLVEGPAPALDAFLAAHDRIELHDIEDLLSLCFEGKRREPCCRILSRRSRGERLDILLAHVQRVGVRSRVLLEFMLE
ncbi:MAG: hypothetical protein AAGA56_16715, partial [Myxococcota bacterium]